MISRIQKQRCIWPTNSGLASDNISHVGRFDKLIGLVPQSYCMFKIFCYKADLIKRHEIDSCIKNELDSLVSWEDYDYFCLINKVEETWQAVVWFWDNQRVVFSQEITHKLPAMAYFFSRCSSEEGVLIYSENFEQSESQWAVKWSRYQVIEQFYPLSSPLHVRSIHQILEQQKVVCFSNNQSLALLKERELTEFKSYGRSQVLSQAKCSSHFDVDNPWQYWRGMVVCALCVVIYMCLDAFLLTYKSSQINQSVDDLQISVAPIQRKLQTYQEQERFLQAFFQAKARQQAPAKLLESLSAALAKDIVIKRFIFEPKSLILEGTIVDTSGLLDALSALPEAKTAKLLGDILPTSDGRQEFRAELILKEAYSWTE